MPEQKRMTDAQRDKLWDLCGRYNVPFREDDYYASWFSPFQNMFPINYEGWIGGNQYSSKTTSPSPDKKTTIYIMVEPDGSSHS